MLLTYCSFTNALAGLAANDIIQRTTARLESLHSEGVHVWENITEFTGKFIPITRFFVKISKMFLLFFAETI